MPTYKDQFSTTKNRWLVLLDHDDKTESSMSNELFNITAQTSAIIAGDAIVRMMKDE